MTTVDDQWKVTKDMFPELYVYDGRPVENIKKLYGNIRGMLRNENPSTWTHFFKWINECSRYYVTISNIYLDEINLVSMNEIATTTKASDCYLVPQWIEDTNTQSNVWCFYFTTSDTATFYSDLKNHNSIESKDSVKSSNAYAVCCKKNIQPYKNKQNQLIGPALTFARLILANLVCNAQISIKDTEIFTKDVYKNKRIGEHETNGFNLEIRNIVNRIDVSLVCQLFVYGKIDNVYRVEKLTWTRSTKTLTFSIVEHVVHKRKITTTTVHEEIDDVGNDIPQMVSKKKKYEE
jgi:hypothetical protein